MIENRRICFLLFTLLCIVSQLNAQTELNPGDLAIVGVNANNNACTSDGYSGPGEDNIHFVCFKDIETGTVIDFTDNGWERLNADQWGDNEGVFRGTYNGSTITAGTVFSLIFRQSAVDADNQNTDWSFTDINFTPRWLNLNSTGDQIYAMQNGEWVDGDDVLYTHDAVYQDGNMIYAFNTKVDWNAFIDNSGDSGLHPEVDPCYHMEPTSGVTNYISYQGPSSSASQLEWINRIRDANNWISYSSCSEFVVPSDISIENSGISVDCQSCSGCAPHDDVLTFTLPTSGGPFNITYTDGSSEFQVNGANNGETVDVTVSESTTYYIRSVTDVNGCPVYSNFEGEAEITINDGPTASITGGGNLCTGQCVEIDIEIIGGNAPYSVELNLSVGVFNFDFTVPTPDLVTTITICSDGFLPDFDVNTLTLTVPELPGASATVTLISIEDDDNCVGTVDPTPLNITIYQSPEANSAGPLEACDDGSGTATFDLSSLDNTIGGANTVNWYEDANLNTAINDPSSYTSGTATVYATSNTDQCESDPVSIELIVTEQPQAQSTSDQLCDSGNGTATFDLTSLEDIVNMGSGLTVNWYSDPNGNNPISSPYTTSSTIVYAQVINGNCNSELVMVNLEVLILPIANSAGPLESCDLGGGIAEFDLSSLENEINGNSGNQVNWYSDANGNNPISSPYVSGNGSVYAGVFDGTCESLLVEIDLIVIDQPDAIAANLDACGNENNQASFDLSLLDDEINLGSGLPVYYYFNTDTLSQVPSPYLTGTTTIYAVVGSGSCRSEVVEVFLNVVQAPVIENPGEVEACESFELPVIEGSNLSGNEAYYDQTGGNGNEYAVGQIITDNLTLFIYDEVGDCSDEESFSITIEIPINPGEDGQLNICFGETNGQNLFEALEGTPEAGGSWMDLDNSGVDLSDPLNIDFSITPIGVYNFEYMLMSQNSCPDQASVVTVTVTDIPDAGENASLSICQGDQSIYNLLDQLGGSPQSGGEWEDTDGSGIDISDPSMVDFSTLDQGNYNFTYSILGNGLCPTVSAILTLNVNNGANAGEDGDGLLCSGDQTPVDLFAILSGNPDSNGTWIDNNNSGVDLNDPNNVDFSNLNEGTYGFNYVIAGSGDCPSDTSLVEITITNQPDAGDSGMLTYCVNTSEPINLFDGLTGAPQSGGTWLDINNSGLDISDPTNVDISQLEPSGYMFSYTIEGTGDCMTDEATVNLTIMESANVGEDGERDICFGSDELINMISVLNGEVDGFGSWDDLDGAGVDLSDPANVDFSTVPIGSYEFMHIIDAMDPCPELTSIATIHIIEGPNAGEDGSLNLCSGDSTPQNLFDALGGNPDANGTWNDLDNSGIDLSDPTMIDFSTLAQGDYNFEYFVPAVQDCPSSSSVVQLTITDEPNAGTNTVLNICQGDNSVYDLLQLLDGNPQNGGSWQDLSNSGIDISDPTNVDFSSLVIDQFNFEYTINGGGQCPTVTALLTIDIIEAPDAGVDNQVQRCEGAFVLDLFANLAGSPQLTGTWTDINNSGVDLSDPAQVDFENIPSGNYVFEYSIAANGNCPSSSSMLTVLILETPNAGEDNQTSFCLGEVTPLNFLALLNGNPDSNGSWTDNDNSGIDLSDPENVDISSLAIGTYQYTYEVMASSGFCPDENATLIIEITDAANAGSDGALDLCLGESSTIDLFLILNDNPEVGGIWTDVDGSGLDISDPSSIDISSLEPGTYNFSYMLSGSGSCPDASSNATLNIFEPPNAGTDGNEAICYLDQGLVDLFEVLNVNPSSDGIWQDLDNSGLDLTDPSSVDFENIAPGIYQFLYILPSIGQCPDAQAIATIEILDELELEAGDDIIASPGANIQLGAVTNALNFDILWSPSTDLSCDDCLDPILTVNQSVSLMITLTDEFGCQISDVLNVTAENGNEVYVPNAFSPNRDGVNDRFYPMTKSDFDGLFDMQIFDRWGNVIFFRQNIEANDPDSGWDGSYNGELLDPAVFAYKIVIKPGFGDPKTITGDIALVK